MTLKWASWLIEDINTYTGRQIVLGSRGQLCDNLLNLWQLSISKLSVSYINSVCESTASYVVVFPSSRLILKGDGKFKTDLGLKKKYLAQQFCCYKKLQFCKTVKFIQYFNWCCKTVYLNIFIFFWLGLQNELKESQLSDLAIETLYSVSMYSLSKDQENWLPRCIMDMLFLTLIN